MGSLDFREGSTWGNVAVDTAEQAEAGMADVRRSELLLTGNRAASLLSSLLSWASVRFGAVGLDLYVPGETGLALLASVGRRDPMLSEYAAVDAIAGLPQEPTELWQGWKLTSGAQTLGSLAVGFTNPHGASHEEMHDAIRLLCHRLPAALELERLYQAMSRLAEAERLQRALYAIADLASGDRETDDVLAAIHAIVAGLMYAENFFIALYDREAEILTFPYFRDVSDEEAPDPATPYPVAQLEGSLTLHVIRTGQSLVGPSEDLLEENGLRPGGYGPQAADWLGVPLLRGQEVMGAIVVQSYDEVRRYTDKERALLNFVAQHIATALERLRIHDELERRVQIRTEELEAANLALRAEIQERERAERLQKSLFRIAELGSTAGSLVDFYASIHALVGELLFARNFYIALLSPDAEQLDFPYSVDEYDAVRVSRKLTRGLTEYVLRESRATLVDRTSINNLERAGEVQTHGTHATFWLGVPLICDERTVGVLVVQSYDHEHSYGQRDQDLLTFVSYHIANALQRKRAAESLRQANAELEQRVVERTEALAAINQELRDQIAERERAERRLRHAALHDALTGLPNRSLLLERMGQALDRYRKDPAAAFAVLFLDLDRFKVVNDSVGHLVGDELLKAAGARISTQVPSDAIVARLGGDEFSVLLESVHGPVEATEAAARIIRALEEPIRIAGKDIYSSTSIGIAFASPHYRTPEELLRDADVALYRAKAQGRHRFEVFDEPLRQEALRQLDLEGNLRRALAQHEFTPVFQPIFSLADGHVMGYESLLRWRHPQMGLLTPAHFLAQAEESGIAEAIDWQVYDIAFSQAHRLIGRDAYLGINVGARHLRLPGFIDDLLERLAHHKLAPSRLRIEMTERALMEDPAQARVLLERLNALGVSIALDDFGTGYSSLSYLHQFPLQALKIDRSFVHPIGSDAPGNSLSVLHAIHALGASLGMELVAEGIETQAQLDLLTSLGCNGGQGFLLGYPASVEELSERGQIAT